jgi:hypothetical protein
VKAIDRDCGEHARNYRDLRGKPLAAPGATIAFIFVQESPPLLQDSTTMLSFRALTRHCFPVLVVSGLLVMTSCGTEDDGLGKRFPVSGNVTYNGEPLEKGSISFVPDDPQGVGATGAIDRGSYTMQTGATADGARAGKYKVTIVAREDSSAKAKADFEKARAARSTGAGADLGAIPKEFLNKAAAAAKSLIPAGYGDLKSTTLTAEVKEQSNSIDFKLSDADAPPEPKVPAKGPGRKGP